MSRGDDAIIAAIESCGVPRYTGESFLRNLAMQGYTVVRVSLDQALDVEDAINDLPGFSHVDGYEGSMVGRDAAIAAVLARLAPAASSTRRSPGSTPMTEHRDPHGNVIEDYHVCGCRPASGPALTAEALTEALDRAWLASNDAYEMARPPDLAGHLWDEVARLARAAACRCDASVGLLHRYPCPLAPAAAEPADEALTYEAWVNRYLAAHPAPEEQRDE